MKDLDTYENNKYKRYESICWIFHFTLPNFPLRWHHYVEIFYSLKDGVVFEVNEKKYELNNGDMIFVWPGELHAILNCPDTGDALILQFDANLITERVDFQHHAYFFYQTRILRYEQCPDLIKKLGQKFLDMDSLKEQNVPFLEMRSCVLLYEFFIDLWEGLQNFDKLDSENTIYIGKESRRMFEICNYITNHCTQDLTLGEVAAKAGFSKYYFSRIFKEYTGQSFCNYLIKERLRIAETLLKDPDLSITDIFQEAGFNSISTFNRVFLKFKKVNPSNFRQMYCIHDGKTDTV